jgi:myo-inositol 2-dehydrogenase/D-chiro-inositol 1-dehydrogenase
VLFEMASGRMVDVECFVSTGVAYEVRTEVVAEDGSAMIGLDLGLVRQSRRPGRRDPRQPASRRTSGSGSAGPTTSSCSAGWTPPAAAHRRPGAWDGYAAQAVCAAGVEALRSGQRTEVRLAQR